MNSLFPARSGAQVCRLLAGSEPSEVIAAQAREAFPGVDQSASATLRFENGVVGHVDVDMRSSRLAYGGFRFNAEAVGTEGTMRVTNFVMPFLSPTTLEPLLGAVPVSS